MSWLFGGSKKESKSTWAVKHRGSASAKVVVEEFFARHDKDRLSDGSVGRLLEQYEGMEGALYTSLEVKYGAPMPKPRGPLTEEELAALRERLMKYYEKNNRAQVSHVDEVLKLYEGLERCIFPELDQKYGTEDATPDEMEAFIEEEGIADSEHRIRLEKFFRSHAPLRLKEVPRLLVQYNGIEDSLFQGLEMKYAKPAAGGRPKPKPTSSAISSTSTFGASGAEGDWRQNTHALPSAFGPGSSGSETVGAGGGVTGRAGGLFGGGGGHGSSSNDPLAHPPPVAAAPSPAPAPAPAAAPLPPFMAPPSVPAPAPAAPAPAPVPATVPAPAPVPASAPTAAAGTVAAVEDVEVLAGEAAAALHKRILGAVLQQFQGDEAKLNQFKAATRKMGRGEVSVSDFYRALESVLGVDFTFKLTKELAKVLPDAPKRLELLGLRQAVKEAAMRQQAAAAAAAVPAPPPTVPEL